MLYTPQKPSLTIEAEKDFLEGLAVSHRYQHPTKANVALVQIPVLSLIDGSLSVHNSLKRDLCCRVQEAYQPGTVDTPDLALLASPRQTPRLHSRRPPALYHRAYLLCTQTSLTPT